MTKIAHKRFQSGMTLIELMVSMLIGLFLLLGAVTVYNQGRQNYTVNEGVARLQENLRFALDVFEPDIRLAGFWGMHSEAAAINPGGIAVNCVDGGNVTNWVFNPAGVGATGLVAFNNVQPGNAEQINPAINCPAHVSRIVTNTDVLEVRRASAQPVNLLPGELQLQSGIQGSTAFNTGAIPPDFINVDPLHMNTFNMVVNSWYVANGSDADPNTPSLRRRTIRAGQVVDEEVIAGVENLQVQLGIDTDAVTDNSVDQYVDPDSPLLATSPVLAVRVWMLIRAENTERGFVDGNTYTPLDSALNPIQPADGFRRMQVSKTIFLRNMNAG